jgi:hypothetical protein
MNLSSSGEFFHTPIDDDEEERLLAPELLHLPGKPAGVG